VVEYTYDAWGNILSVTGPLADTVGMKNPYRYRGYRYDNETEWYYLQSRYYNPQWGRFINTDAVILTDARDLALAAYCYCNNNPIMYHDPSGYIIETIFDVGGIIWSLYDFIIKPSWANFGSLAWDVGAAFIPFVPGSYTAKGVKLTAKLVGSFNDVTRWTVKGGRISVKIANSISDIARMKGVYLDTYNNLRRIFRAPRIEVHHLVEVRFSKLFSGITTGSYLSIPLPKWLHRELTNRWYGVIKYGTHYSKLSKSSLIAMVSQVYYDMPAIKNQVILLDTALL
jgi:RHS repeat-associated protein